MTRANATASHGRSACGRGALVRVAINLIARGSQTCDSVTIEISFPGEKLIDRDAVKFTDLLDRDPTIAYGLNNGSLAPNRPALMGLRQFRHEAKSVWRVRFERSRLAGLQGKLKDSSE